MLLFFFIKNYSHEKLAHWWSLLIGKLRPDILTLSMCFYRDCGRRNLPLKAQKAQISPGGNVGVNLTFYKNLSYFLTINCTLLKMANRKNYKISGLAPSTTLPKKSRPPAEKSASKTFTKAATPTQLSKAVRIWKKEISEKKSWVNIDRNQSKCYLLFGDVLNNPRFFNTLVF